MAEAVYVCELCNYRGTSGLICGTCGKKLIYVDRENAFCPTCGKYMHGYNGYCDGCGMVLENYQVHFEPLD